MERTSGEITRICDGVTLKLDPSHFREARTEETDSVLGNDSLCPQLDFEKPPLHRKPYQSRGEPRECTKHGLSPTTIRPKRIALASSV